MNPAALVRSNAIVYLGVTNDDLWLEKAHTGTAGSQFGLSGLQRLLAFTTGDRAKVYRDVGQRQAPQDPTWDTDRTVAFTVDFQPPTTDPGDGAYPDSVADSIQYFTSGDPEAGDPGFGFKLEMVDGAPLLRGVAHDGASETVSELDLRPGELPSSGRVTLRAEYWPASSGEIDYFVNGRQVGSGFGMADGGTTAADRLFTASVETETDAWRVTDVDARVVQR